MILRIILKNFLSFKDEVQFDMFPNTKRTSLSNHISTFSDKLPVLKMAAIYGSNGSGKSNLLKGVNFLKEIASNKDFLNKENIGRYIFALQEKAEAESLSLTIEFITKLGVPFIYSVEIANSGIEFESLLISGLGSEDNQNVFTRKGSQIEYSVEPSDEIKNLIAGWTEKFPFASLLTINNDMPVLSDKNISAAQSWFEEELIIVGIHSFTPTLIELFKDNEDINKFASDLFRAIDLGVEDVIVETENFEDWIKTHDTNDIPLDKLKKMQSGGVLSQVENFRPTKIISVEDGVQKISQIMFKQFGENGFSKNMDIQAQSDGTVRMLSLIPALYYALRLNKTVFIDEIDHSIHPHLIRSLVRYFSKQKVNGQLIFTTHQTCLLNQEFMRTDEVWLVEKTRGNSRMYSLNDFKIHNTINIENGYLEGRYGAIPFIGDVNL